MGCGQSKIGIIYPRKNKRKGCNKKSGAEADGEDEAEEADRGTVSPTSDEDEDAKKRAAAARIRQLVSSGPLLAHTEISSSQLDFFKMLDEKIENGPDYDSTNEEEMAMERTRLAALIRDWESASCSTSTGSRSLPSTPPRRPTAPAPAPALGKQYYLQQHHPPPVPLANGDLFLQHQYYQQFQQQQHPAMRAHFYLPAAQLQYPRPGPLPRPYQYQYPHPHPHPHAHPHAQPPPPHPHPQATAVVRYGKARGVFTELA